MYDIFSFIFEPDTKLDELGGDEPTKRAAVDAAISESLRDLPPQ